MELSTFAYIVGIVELLIGFPMILYPEKTTQWILDTMKNDTIIRIMGFFFVAISFLVLKNDASVTFDVRGLVSLIAVVTGIKCIVMCWKPEWLIGISEKKLLLYSSQRIYGVLPVLAGVLFMWAGCSLG